MDRPRIRSHPLLPAIAALALVLTGVSDGRAQSAPELERRANAPSRALPGDRRLTLDVLTYNVQLPPFLPKGQDVRTPLFAGQLGGYDVLLLQEVFSDYHRKILLRDLAAAYPHQSRILGRDRGIAQDGGVVIVSKWPIELQFQKLFGELCAGKDCLGDKGVLYARINKAGRRIHLFATHLQSGVEHAATRQRQVVVVKRLIDSMGLPADEPVLIGGDLNVDRFSDGRDGAFTAMTRTLDAGHPPPPPRAGHAATLDPDRNPLASGASAAKYIDYVLVSNAHLRPAAASNAVRRVFAEGRSLSDHFAVHGRFSFDAPPPAGRPGTFPLVEIFEGADERRDFVCGLALDSDRRIDLTEQRECGGASERAFTLRDVPAGRVIRFFDSPDGSRNDDWIEIVPKRHIASRRFESFEQNVDDAEVTVTYFHRDGLDGDVSAMESSAADTQVGAN
jgi:endonuclease/exonuclease/phosphatase family metal-dependent hydrolase